ncbi:tRNA lysidine(34) synthetase TilS [Thiomicrorhabdus sp. zzn3]|uniref:tRNA lysidine(34) synthetase TilS n=1 Tax=Thiomicrorhabdus sp. zzn3 TaxID=3039775 RepID=UPI00243669DD|nr:tRNA lysidine(34) synthetase TilS [Thiomicrorhabdus sp. zzn3]MDG6778000.1 tRNA lysidine(34) synthetase TilS [Thiomicrorhabdus sp. zzn3]
MADRKSQSDSSYQSTIDSAIEVCRVQFDAAPRIIVAYSGGLDSSVLLHRLASEVAWKAKLLAIHIDHQLQAESTQWALHCDKQCQHLNVAFKSIKVEIQPQTRTGTEALARNARYNALHHSLENGDLLLTAHHQRDQAETFLLNLARGSGVKGLSAMPASKHIRLPMQVQTKPQRALHLRPFLSVPYADLVAYAQQHQLQWIEDPSNQDTNLRRNFIRHQVLPAFKQAWPHIERHIARSAHYMSEAELLLKRMAQQQLKTYGFLSFALDLNRYSHLDWLELKNVLRHWSEDSAQFTLGHSRLEWIKQHTHEKECPQACLKLNRGEIRLDRKKIYYIQAPYLPYQIDYSILQDRLAELAQNNWAKRYQLDLPFTLNEPDLNHLHIRCLQPQDPVNRTSLKKWFQTQNIPAWQRAFWPVISLKQQFVGVLGWPKSLVIPGDLVETSESEKNASAPGLSISLDEETIHMLASGQFSSQAIEAKQKPSMNLRSIEPVINIDEKPHLS